MQKQTRIWTHASWALNQNTNGFQFFPKQCHGGLRGKGRKKKPAHITIESLNEITPFKLLPVLFIILEAIPKPQF